MHCKHKTTKRNYVFFGFSHSPFCHCASFSKPRKYMPIPKPEPERAAWCFSLCKCTHSGAHTFITFISGSDITLLLLFCVYLELIGALACIRNLKLTVLGFTDKGWKEGEAAEQYCLPLQSRTPPLLFSRYTPPLSSRLIKKCNHSFSFKATSGRFLRKNVSFSAFPAPSLGVSLSLCSSTMVLWPSLELDELCLIIKGICGAEFGCGVPVSYRHCGGGACSCLKGKSPVCAPDVFSACCQGGHKMVCSHLCLISFRECVH